MAFIYVNERPGLKEEVDYFRAYLERSSIEHFLYSWDIRTIIRFVKNTLFFDRSKVVLFVHEPFGFKHYYKKGDKLIYYVPYILIRELLVLLYGRRSCRTPSLYYLDKNKRFRYLPLVRMSISPSNVSDREIVVMLGGNKPYRGVEKFNSISILDDVREYMRFSDLKDKSTFAKYRLLAKRVLATFNVYDVPYSISGVHLDSLSHGIPLILSEKDYYYSFYLSKGFYIIGWTSPERVIQELNDMNLDEIIHKNIAIYERVHGSIAVKSYEEL